MKKPPEAPPSAEVNLQRLNDWIAWLDSWVDHPPKYTYSGPLEETEGVKRLANFLREVAYAPKTFFGGKYE